MYNSKPLPIAPMEGNDRIDTEKNWIEFSRLLTETKRQGVEELLGILGDKTDFKIAPASHKHHLAVRGGLCQHSLNVYKYANELNNLVGLDLPAESLTIASLLHDLCKIHYYKISAELDKEHKELTGEWRKKQMYVVEDKLPLGHGEKSVILAQQYGIKLETDEVLAIRWHMAFSDSGVHFGYPSGMPFRQSFSSPIVQIIAMADQLAVIHEDNIWTKEIKKP